MRLWLKDSERRPDPAPVKTDDRTAAVVGLGLWLLGLAIVLLFGHLAPVGREVLLWTCAAGIAIGLLGLITTHRGQSR